MISQQFFLFFWEIDDTGEVPILKESVGGVIAIAELSENSIGASYFEPVINSCKGVIGQYN